MMKQILTLKQHKIDRSGRFRSALVLAVLVMSGCDKQVEVPVRPEVPVSLSTAPVEFRRIAVETQFDGTVEAVNQATVSAQTSGRITHLNYDVGDYVPQDSVILQITDTEQAAQLDAATSRLNEARVHLADAERQLERNRELLAQKLVAKAEFDRAEAAYKAALAREKTAAAALKQAQQNLQYTKIAAPYSGIVLARHVQAGETVAPGTPLMTGVSLDQLRVVVSIPQNFIDPLRIHKSARVLLSENVSIEAQDIRIPPGADATTHSFRVLLSLPHVENQPVFPGTLVKVNFVTGERQRLVLQQSALARRGEVTGAYVIDNKRISFRYIRVGALTAEGVYPVMSGLEVNEEVALDPVAAAIAYKQQHAMPEESAHE